MILDGAVAFLFFQIGLRYSPYASRPDVVDLAFPLSVVFAVAFGAISLGLGSSDRDQRFDYLSIARNTLIAAVLASLVNLAYHYFTLYAVVGRFTLVYGAASATIGIVAVRAVLAYAVRRHPYRFTIIGTSQMVEELRAALVAEPRDDGMHVLVPWASIFAEGQELSADRLVQADLAEIVVAPSALTEDEAIQVALLGLRANIPLVDDRTFYGRVFERLPVDEVPKRWILEQGLARPQAVVLVAKRMADVVLAAVALVRAFTPARGRGRCREAVQPGARDLRPGAAGPLPSAIQDLQVPLHAGGCKLGRRIYAPGRRASHARGAGDSSHTYRRAAAARQRSPR